MNINTRNRERGSAMVETAICIPLLLVLMVGIFEVGRAYETWQVLTNAALEGARMAVLPSGSAADTTALVRQYMSNGQLTKSATAAVVAMPVAILAGAVCGR